MSEIRESIKIIPIDITNNISSELERLHDVISNNGGSANKETREWAQAKIDKIHDALFKPTYVVGDMSMRGE